MKRTNILIHVFLVAMVLIFAVSDAAAQSNTSIGEEFPVMFRGVRPLGMGNAFTAMPGTDLNAQFYNPAAINDYKDERHYNILNPEADFDIGVIPMIKDVFDLNDDMKAAATTSDKLNVFDAFTQSHAGEFNEIASYMPLFQIRNKYYAATLLFSSHTIVSLRNRAFPNFEIRSRNFGGGVGGGAYAFFDDTLQVGGNLKVLYQVGIEQTVSSGDIVNQSLGDIIGWSQWKKGIGIGADLGAKYKLPFAQELLQPTLSLVIQDVVQTYFFGGAAKIPMSLTMGAGIFPKLGPVQLSIVTDFREINQREDILNKFHFGVEAIFPKVIHTVFALRAGCNQGYPAAGFGAQWPIVGLNFAFYGQELGEYTREKADYRLVAQLTFGF